MPPSAVKRKHQTVCAIHHQLLLKNKSKHLVQIICQRRQHCLALLMADNSLKNTEAKTAKQVVNCWLEMLVTFNVSKALYVQLCAEKETVEMSAPTN